jgi:hypothetical protein
MRIRSRFSLKIAGFGDFRNLFFQQNNETLAECQALVKDLQVVIKHIGGGAKVGIRMSPAQFGFPRSQRGFGPDLQGPFFCGDRFDLPFQTGAEFPGILRQGGDVFK